jgi:tRNA (guanine9-N1)-methyltransferase
VASKASEQAAAEGDAEKPQDALAEGEVIYLSSESDNVLTHLTPGSTYIIGGLVDKNRHKGICHKRAVARGIKTAKLPIGEFLEMKSRQVLVTNHVLEIMLKWMEFGDWGKAFMTVLPERKGAKLKQDGEGAEGDEAKADADTEADANADPTDQEMADAAKEVEAVSSAPVAGEDQNVETTAAEGDQVV